MNRFVDEIIAGSRLPCELCHGTGYFATALGKLPPFTCSKSEFVSPGQGQSEVSNHQGRPTLAEKLFALVEQMSAVRKNSADLRCGGLICLVFGFGKAFTRAEVDDYSASFYRKLGVPFPNIGADGDLNRFKRHDEFVSVHFGVEVGADQGAKDLVADRPEDWITISRSFLMQRIPHLGNSNRKVVSNQQKMPGEGN